MIQCSNNLFKSIWEDLTLFEKKILCGIGCHVKKAEAKTKVYKVRLIEFGLDKLNPSDITERLKRLQEKAIPMTIDDQIAYVPLLTDVRYDDLKKTVTITFNSLLKPGYRALGEGELSWM